MGEFLGSFSMDLSNRGFTLDNFIDVITTCFSVDTVEDILHELWKDGTLFSRSLATEIQKQSPISLKITQKQLKLGANMNLRDCLQMEYRLACAALDKKVSHDFYEGENLWEFVPSKVLQKLGRCTDSF